MQDEQLVQLKKSQVKSMGKVLKQQKAQIKNLKEKIDSLQKIVQQKDILISQYKAASQSNHRQQLQILQAKHHDSLLQLDRLRDLSNQHFMLRQELTRSEKEIQKGNIHSEEYKRMQRRVVQFKQEARLSQDRLQHIQEAQQVMITEFNQLKAQNAKRLAEMEQKEAWLVLLQKQNEQLKTREWRLGERLKENQLEFIEKQILFHQKIQSLDHQKSKLLSQLSQNVELIKSHEAAIQSLKSAPKDQQYRELQDNIRALKSALVSTRQAEQQKQRKIRELRQIIAFLMKKIGKQDPSLNEWTDPVQQQSWRQIKESRRLNREDLLVALQKSALENQRNRESLQLLSAEINTLMRKST